MDYLGYLLIGDKDLEMRWQSPRRVQSRSALMVIVLPVSHKSWAIGSAPTYYEYTNLVSLRPAQCVFSPQSMTFELCCSECLGLQKPGCIVPCGTKLHVVDCQSFNQFHPIHSPGRRNHPSLKWRCRPVFQCSRSGDEGDSHSHISV